MYRIVTEEGKIKFAGTGRDSWFSSLDEARKHAGPRDCIYEYSTKTGERLWEVL